MLGGHSAVYSFMKTSYHHASVLLLRALSSDASSKLAPDMRYTNITTSSWVVVSLEEWVFLGCQQLHAD